MSGETASAPPPGVTINLIDPEYIGYQLVTVSISLVCFSGLFLGLRLYTRKSIVRSLGWDDWWIVCAWLSGVALTITDCIQTKYGAGIHLWDVRIPTYEMFLKVQLVLGGTYVITLAFAKVSICCFYLRLSPDRMFRTLVYLTIAFTVSYSLAGLLIGMFSCTPVAASWDIELAKLPTTTCINRPTIFLVLAGLNLLTEFCIIILPLPTIWKLQLPFRQKLIISLIFAVGLFVCIISMIRIKSVVKVLNSSDLSWDSNALFIWTTIEAHVTIFCACLPTLKPLINRFFPKLLGRTAPSSHYSENNNRNNAPVHPSDPGKRTKLTKNSGNANNPYRYSDGYPASTNSELRTFSLRGYRERVMGRSQHRAVVTSGAMARRRDVEHGDDDSQQGIIVDGMEHDMMDFKSKGVFVTRTVHVSW